MTRETYATLQLKIQKEIERLQKQAQALQKKQRTPVIRSIVRSMHEYNISPDEIIAAFNKKTTKSPASQTADGSQTRLKRPVPAKYRDPASGNEWTGRGKAPRWITASEEAGTPRAQYLINPDQ